MSQSSWNALPSAMKTLISFGVLVIITLSIVLVYVATKPELGTLYTDLKEEEAAYIVQDLKAMGVPYEVTNNGSTVLVDKTQINDTRLQLTSNGTLNKNSVGLELFKEADYGMTEFAQRVNYQRAMQGEIARTLMTLDAVDFARVHLTIPKEGLLISKKEQPKAAITIVETPGLRLTDQQILGIQRTVAGSVKNLKADDVTILNGQGELISRVASDDNGLALSKNQHDQKQVIEQETRSKISQLLDSVYALERYSVAVDAQLDFNKKKEVNNKILNGKEKILVSKKERKTSTQTKSGKKGDASNGKTNSDVEYQYLHGSSVEEIEYASGTLKTLSVGIIVPDRFSPEQLDSLREVIAAAIGFDASRGDKLKLVAFPLEAIGQPAQASVSDNTSTLEKAMVANASNVESSKGELSNIDSKPVVKNNDMIENLFSNVPAHYMPYIVLIMMLLLITSVFVFIGKQRSNSPKRLSQEQRKLALEEINQWLKQAK